MRRILVSACLAFAALSVSSIAIAEKSAYYTGHFSDVAVGGYDLVSFFNEGAPVEGDKAYSTDIGGVKFHFASQENLDAFVANPEAYPLEYGGYCAWAAAQGKKAKGSPKHWNIVDGKLYLNFNKSIKAKWEKDIPGFIEAADKEWPALLED